MSCVLVVFIFFFFNDTATTEIYTLSLHDALPICSNYPMKQSRKPTSSCAPPGSATISSAFIPVRRARKNSGRSEEHTSELQSQSNLVCRLLLEKKKTDRRTSQPPKR